MFEEDTVFDFDIDAIMEGTESTLDMLLDDEEAFDAECEATVISDDIDDMAIDNIIGLDGLVTDDDIEAIDRGDQPVNANDPIDPIEDDAESGASDPEIFRLQKDLFQNTLLSEDDIKDLKEGMSIEDFTAKVMQESEEMPVITTTSEDNENVCGECHHSPCICANPIDKPDEIKISFDLDKDFEKHKDDDDFKVDDDDDDFEDFDDDEVNAPMNTPAGPVQPLHGGESDNNVEDDSDSSLPFAPSGNEENEIETSLSELEDTNEEGDVEDMYTEEELNAIESAYAEGYARRMDEYEEAVQEGAEDLTEEEAAMLEVYEAGYQAALEDVINETSEDDEIMSEDTDDIDEMLASIQEGLEDIEIENDFEGSGINADQKNANGDMFAGWDKNIDEPGGTTQNDTTLPFENVTVKGFSDLEDDSKACMIK